jgi:hypothetical protein
MENILVVVGLFNFYNVVSNDIIIETKHEILNKANLLLYTEYIIQKYHLSDNAFQKHKVIKKLIENINIAIHSANIQIDIDTKIKSGDIDPASISITTEKRITPNRKKSKKKTD